MSSTPVVAWLPSQLNCKSDISVNEPAEISTVNFRVACAAASQQYRIEAIWFSR